MSDGTLGFWVRMDAAVDVSPSRAATVCRVYWGSHGCDLVRGHDGPHVCADCFDPEDTSGYVGRPPYYGPDTWFYGEDVPVAPGVPVS